jgi:CrcB protein
LLRHYLWIGLFGAAGAVCRWLVGVLLLPYTVPGSFPWSTWVCNLLGCALIGWLASRQSGLWTNRWMIGFAGSFTTFSAFSAEALALLQMDLHLLWLSYSLSSFLAGWLLMVWTASLKEASV